MSQPYKKRISAVVRKLKGHGKAAMILSSAPQVLRSADEAHVYRQNSDFYYLTGSLTPGVVLVVRYDGAVTAIIPKPSRHQLLWDGRFPKPTIPAETVLSQDVVASAKKKLDGIEVLFFQNTPGSLSWDITQSYLRPLAHERGRQPTAFHFCEEILTSLRVVKDAQEIKLIAEAGRITSGALTAALPLIAPGTLENEIAARIEYEYWRVGAGTGFPTIVASGPSAAVLHYRHKTRKLGRGEMLLIDAGAEHQLYNGDITRMFPVAEPFSKWQSVIYTAVLEAQSEAISKIRAGDLIIGPYDAAATRLTEGLVELGVLKGRVATLVKNKEYRPYFPHGIGHSLGIDVHDVGPHRGNNTARFVEGMVFTVEPGLYFPKPFHSRFGKLPACGVRIEDDVAVTKSGCKLLTFFPKELEAVESMALVASQKRPRKEVRLRQSARR